MLKMYLIIFMKISVFAYSKIWHNLTLKCDIIFNHFMCKMISIDKRISCYYHIKNPQKSVMVKNDYMQISG